MKKLIKLSAIHYVITDDSEIKIGDWAIHNNKQYREEYDALIILCNQSNYLSIQEHWDKIIYSTPYLPVLLEAGVKELSLSEVEEVIYGYNIDKMADEYFRQQYSWSKDHTLPYSDKQINCIKNDYIAGFKACQKITKDKLFTIQQVFDAIGLAIGLYSPTYASFEEGWKKKITQHLIQIEGDIEIINDKIVIL